ncbi:undecaprenyldiphospho-muramoylpentapeptide beta-N-acetylglucosaminyltransferase [Helicobacter sp. 12S02634-8]|uniref:undecaprenyldiphospho-muramoylpentapeptide beta-N-acetylglucosaminyltransferase n=1 Tax=Helicobacter sp. 12S02634-8 TaxID=1476199 RepID=UPI000BA5A4B9|nr:undecaprenyldiphospho-muramoylpentapeptide beta-N-acetylglucosaminyltransferase [Helicobacter sp. 12S02634-8]PAF47557.1 undecaprenyldiphospho-muramoylpentapeptide beta-N-acetylglucosaminyltransferase [Helicobacter sp. 12S02634-8]
MNIAITGGGTGGHLAIAKALGGALIEQGNQVIYIGSMSGQDRDWFGDKGLFSHCYFLNTSGVINQKGLGKLKSLYKQLTALGCVRNIFKTHQIHYVLSVGGFSAGPASLGAILFRIPLFIHEQNSIKGALNKFLSPFARAVFGSFTHQGKNYIKTSYPIRSEFFTQARIRKAVRCVIFLGGSQGARAINDFAILCAKKLTEKGIKVIHQCGKNDLERVREIYKKLEILEYIDIFDFDKNLVEKIASADLYVGRAGASTVWELCANGLSGLFIPYPYGANDHQYYNALEFQKDGLGLIVRQNDLSPNALFDYIDALEISDTDGVKNISKISLRLRDKINADGASAIIKEISERLK